MELDKRIIEGKRPLTCFDLKEASDFLKKTGYFANELDYFSDLSKVVTDCCSEVYYGKLLGIKDKRCVFKYLSMDCSRESSYRFFLPEEWIKKPEKKYRPYSLNEFSELYAIGDVVTYRIKDCEVVEQSMLIGFQSSDDEDIPGDGYVLIGNCRYSLKELFNNYELNYQNEWQPFGILVENE